MQQLLKVQDQRARRAAKAGLLPFTQYTEPTYEAAEHHKIIADALESVERGECDRLCIFMPPRHGKSELASRRFPAWYLGRNPTKQIIAASYNSELATDFGRDVRNIVDSKEYRAVFDLSLAADSQSKKRWHTSQGGVYYAAGVDTAVTGRGANLLLIDDPLKDRAEADSETIRQNVWSWYTSTARTRLMPGAAIVIIQTRWHDDDLAGRLLERRPDRWRVLSLPALKDGEALWPEWYPVPVLDEIRQDIGEREWSALYQQQPQPDEGTFFKREWFRWFEPDHTPKHLRIFGSSDYALTEGGGDWTECGVFGIDPDGDIYVCDWWSGQTTADVWIDAELQLVRKHKPLAWFSEAGPIRRATEPFITRRMRETRLFCRREWIAVSGLGDKATRARAFQARASMGKVYLPNNDAGHALLEQLLRFPAGAHDDKVDTCALIGMALDQAHPAMGPGRPKRSGPRDRWDRIDGEGGENWKVA